MSCGRRLADGQDWSFCGETDMGLTSAALCTECGDKYGFILAGVDNERSAVSVANFARKVALERWAESGHVGRLEDY